MRRVRLGQFSAESPKVARLVLDLTQTAPYRIIDGADGVRIVFGESGRARPGRARAPRGAARARAAPRRSRWRSPRPARGRRAARPAPAARAPGSRAALGARRGRAGAGERRDGLRPDRLPRHADQPGLQGRRPAGHLPALLRHLRPQRRGEPGGHRQGHPEAQRGAVGPGPRAHPQDERPRLRPRGQRHPDREAHRPPEGGGRPSQAATRRRSSTASSWTSRAGSPTRRPTRCPACSSRRTLSPLAARSTSTFARTRSSSGTCRASLEKAKGLIAELDTATPQVEIEARIVVTTRNFTRDLGIQWGFGAEATPRYGNTTQQRLPELDRPERRRRAEQPGPPGRQHRAGRAVVGRRDRDREPRVRRQPAGERFQQRPSASRWATSSGASTSTWP